MTANSAKELPQGIKIPCYACGDRPATHVCRYHVDELRVQVCLCKSCMKMDTEDLLKNTLGIDNPPETLAQEYLIV